MRELIKQILLQENKKQISEKMQKLIFDYLNSRFVGVHNHDDGSVHVYEKDNVTFRGNIVDRTLEEPKYVNVSGLATLIRQDFAIGLMSALSHATAWANTQPYEYESYEEYDDEEGY